MTQALLITDGIKSVEDAHRVIEVFGDQLKAAPIHERRERLARALSDASRKLDTPRRKRAKPRNGVKESDRELMRRMNWLRERIAEVSAA